MAAHPVGLELEQRRPVALPRALGRPPHGAHHPQQVVAVDHQARHAVAQPAVGEVAAGVLLVGRRRQAPLVVLDHEDHRQLPDRREVQRLVEVALARGAVAGEGRRDAPLAAQLRREREAAGHRQHRAEVADHPDDALLERAEVEGAVAALREAALAAEQLAEEPRQVEVASGEDARGCGASAGRSRRARAPSRRRWRSPPGRCRRTTWRAAPGAAAPASSPRSSAAAAASGRSAAAPRPRSLRRRRRSAGARSRGRVRPCTNILGRRARRGKCLGRLGLRSSEVKMAGARRSCTALAAVVRSSRRRAVPRPGRGRRRGLRDPSLFRELRWRPIGPFRGGRTKAATGVRGRPGLFYIGVVNGGIWKTTDYGRTWQPIFDDQPTGSIGAIAVAPSNPDVIYVGSGEGMQRPDLSTGDGLYKSTDGGQDLAPPRAARRPADPADRRGPEGREAAVRGRARPPVRAERRARPLPLDGRGRELREGAVPRRGHGRRRRGARSERPERGLRGAVGGAPGPVGERRLHRSGQRALQVAGRRADLAAAGGRAADLRRGPRPDRDHAWPRATRGGCTRPSRRAARRASTAPTTRARAGAASTPTRASWRGRATRPRCGCTRRIPTRVFVPTIVAWKSTDGGKTLHGLPRRARRRRLPAHLDRPRPPGRDDPVRGPGRHRHRQRRRDAGAAGTTSRPRSSTT